MALLRLIMATVPVKVRFGHRALFGVFIAVTALAQTIDEYKVKAAFVYNFAKFVEWPAETFKTAMDPFRICVLGQDPFGGALGSTVNGKTLLGRPFVVADIGDVSQAGDCQILFVASSENKRLRAILTGLRTVGTLTVGETEGFAGLGGIINFKIDDGRVRFEINVVAAERAKLRISSNLLNLAQIVRAAAQH
jgi:hypothetical protein